jgi:hypothetical protein
VDNFQNECTSLLINASEQGNCSLAICEGKDLLDMEGWKQIEQQFRAKKGTSIDKEHIVSDVEGKGNPFNARCLAWHTRMLGNVCCLLLRTSQ